MGPIFLFYDELLNLVEFDLRNDCALSYNFMGPSTS